MPAAMPRLDGAQFRREEGDRSVASDPSDTSGRSASNDMIATLNEKSGKGLPDFNRHFIKHTERGAALAICAALDHALGELIKSRMIDDNDAKEWMFNDVGPLGNFGIRIRIAYLMGIITHETREELITISKIRNTFAHNISASGFKYPRIQGLFSGLKYIGIARLLQKDCLTKYNSMHAKYRKIIQRYDLDDPRYAFIAVCLMLISIMIIHKTSSPDLPEPEI